jgi:hypothetical protein
VHRAQPELPRVSAPLDLPVRARATCSEPLKQRS